MPNGDLTPTQGMTQAARRPAGICYVKIAVDITFTDLDSTDGQAYPFTYFVRLPMENHTVQNSTGNDVELNTFHLHPCASQPRSYLGQRKVPQEAILAHPSNDH